MASTVALEVVDGVQFKIAVSLIIAHNQQHIRQPTSYGRRDR